MLNTSELHKNFLLRDAITYLNFLKKVCQVTAEATKKTEVIIAISCFMQTL